MKANEIVLPIDEIEKIIDFDKKMTGNRMTIEDALRFSIYITNHVISDKKLLYLLLDKFGD